VDLDPPQRSDPVERLLVRELAPQRVRGISRIDDHAALPQNSRGLLEKPALRVDGMHLEKLGHGGHCTSRASKDLAPPPRLLGTARHERNGRLALRCTR